MSPEIQTSGWWDGLWRSGRSEKEAFGKDRQVDVGAILRLHRSDSLPMGEN
jgi:hypothetical protein